MISSRQIQLQNPNRALGSVAVITPLQETQWGEETCMDWMSGLRTGPLSGLHICATLGMMLRVKSQWLVKKITRNPEHDP